MILGAALTSALLVACNNGKVRGKVRGEITVTVTYDNKPVTEGTVELSNPETGEGGGGNLNAEGVATLKGVAVGTYTVTVLPIFPEPPTPDSPPPVMKEYPNIPEKFRRQNTSPLKAEVKQGEPGHFKFELKE